jgi:hypothetical protein
MISSGSKSRLKEENKRGGKAQDHMGNKEQIKGNSPSNRALLRGAALLRLLAFVHGLGVFSSGDGGGDEE